MRSAADSYRLTLERLEAQGRFGVRLGLERMAVVLARLGHPHRKFLSVHLAGTNGKGSTAAMIASCLQQAGRRTGLYTSPHLSRFTERIRVDGVEVSRDEVVRLAAVVLETDPELSFFEVVTGMAFVHLAEQGVEVAVVETGLGGRLDATNVIDPLVCVLTRIGLDHTDVLGRELRQVAREKAGIIKPGRAVVCAPLATEEVTRVVEDRCRDLDAKLWLLGRDFHLSAAREAEGLPWSAGRARYIGPDGPVLLPRLGLAGGFQLENAALCLAAIDQLRRHGINVDAQHLHRGLADVRWPGRFEWVGRHLLDGAHNPGGTRALAHSLSDGERFTLVFGVIGERDAVELVQPLLPRCGRVIVTRARSERAAEPPDLARALGPLVQGKVEVARDLEQALRLASDSAEPVLVTGSLYLVGEARELLLGEPADPVRIADPLGRVR